MDAASLEKGLLDSPFHNERCAQSLLREITVSDGKQSTPSKWGVMTCAPVEAGKNIRNAAGGKPLMEPRIELAQVIQAVEAAGDAFAYFYDRQTGETVCSQTRSSQAGG